MRKLAVFGFLAGLALNGQTATGPLSCLETIGPISYPPYEWGRESTLSVRTTVKIGSNGTAEILLTNGRSDGWKTAFEREVAQSIAASTFDSQCSGQTLLLSYTFELKGERGASRETVTTRAEPNRVVVTARPPALICDAAARSDDEAEVFRGRSDWLLDEKRFPDALQCAQASIEWKPTANAYIDKGVALRK